MIGIELTSKILERHKSYILDSNLESRITELTDNDGSIISKYDPDFRGEHKQFCNFILNEINNLSKIVIHNNESVNIENNLFLSNVSVLNEKIKYVNNNYNKIAKAFSSPKELDINYTNYVLDCFGYEEFSSDKEINYYQEELNFINKFSNKHINEIINDFKKKKKVNRVNNYVLMDTKKYIIDELQLFCKNNDDNLVVSLIEKTINNINNINCFKKNDFIFEIVEEIKYLKSKIREINIDESFLNLINYKKWDMHGRINNCEWNAYYYLFELGLEVCPYCNRQYITPIHWEKGKMRADLDHFFAKNLYPYLSISIYNLVPSCKFCNSSLKNTKEFNYDDFINPFDCGQEDVFEFDFIPNSYDSFYGKDTVNIVVNYISNDKSLNKKYQNNMRVFNIEQLYQYHSDVVKELLRKRYIYNDSYMNYLLEHYRDLFKDRGDVVRLLLGAVNDDIKNISLGKLKSDIIKKLFFYNIVSAKDLVLT